MKVATPTPEATPQNARIGTYATNCFVWTPKILEADLRVGPEMYCANQVLVSLEKHASKLQTYCHF